MLKPKHGARLVGVVCASPQAQGTLNLKSVKPALLFLFGLFCYDIYFVFLAPGGVMESVATTVEVGGSALCLT